ncbi:MAG: hypothetical protein IKY63_03995 [Tidjanibacter sp.]|nr:hypothetical protein [Tidjanibacter sp.]
MKKLSQIALMMAAALMVACGPVPTPEPEPNPGDGPGTENPEPEPEPEPTADTYGLMGDFENNNWTTDIPLVEEGDYLVAQDVVFANANNEGLAFKVRKNASWDVSYGADGSTFDLGVAIALNGGSNVFVNGEVGAKYDFYFTVEPMTIYVMPDGYKPGDTLPEPEPEPEPEMVEVTAIEIFCNYYGDAFGGPGYNYFITLTDVGFDEDGYVVSNSKNYALDLYSEIATEGNEGTIPAGTYTLDELDTMEPGTMGTYGYALMCGAAEDGSEDVEYLYTAGTVVISENKIEATLTLDNGEVHHIVYEGSLAFSNATEEEVTGWSQLLGDMDVNSNEAFYAIEPYGDYYEVGVDNYMVHIYQGVDMELGEPTGAYLALELLASGLNTTDCLGDYTVFDGYSFTNVFLPGSLLEEDGETYAVGSIVMDMTNYVMGPIADGSISIEAGEGSNLVITLDCVDDCGNVIAGTLNAADLYGTASMMAPAKAAKKPVATTRTKLFSKRNVQKIAR